MSIAFAPVAAPSAPLLPTLRLGPALLVAAASGPVLDAAFPDRGWWPLLFLGLGMFFWALQGRRFWSGVLVGVVGGLSFYGFLIWWSTVYLGLLPWFGLTAVSTLFYAAAAGLIAVVWRRAASFGASRTARWAIIPSVVAALWVLRETVYSVWPFGGFSWARLAFALPESAFSPLIAYLGVGGVGFIVAGVVALAVQLARDVEVPVARRAAVLALALIVPLIVPAWPTPATGTLRVSAVQGNTDSGLNAVVRPGDNLVKHAEESLTLAGKDPDVVLWPENAADIDPLRSPEAAALLDELTEFLGAPILTGAVTANAGGETFNSMLQWAPGEGAVDQYDKIHPVPFAEYLPARAFFYPLAPELFGLIPRDYSFGSRDNVMTVGDAVAGVAICFDIVDDALLRQMVDDGAELILAPTNNADFGRSDESAQQLAIARVRAIETGRSVVNASTVGISAVIAPDGSLEQTLPTFRAGTLTADVPLSTTTTPALMLGRGLEVAAGAWALGGVLLALTGSRRSTAQALRRPPRRSRRI